MRFCRELTYSLHALRALRITVKGSIFIVSFFTKSFDCSLRYESLVVLNNQLLPSIEIADIIRDASCFTSFL